MKSLIIAISFCFLSLGAFAQSASTTKSAAPNPTKMAASAKLTAPAYRCPVCGSASAKAGECAKDKVTFVKVGDYYCPDCYMTATKAGKCSMCGVDMKKMDATSSIAPAKK